MATRVRTLFTTSLLTLALTTTAAAQTPNAPAGSAPDAGELITDRPDFTESSAVIRRGLFQFESGLSFEADRESGVQHRSVAAPAALLRIGLGFRSELRLGGEGWLAESAAGSRNSGYSDFEIGAKTQLLSQDDHLIDLALLPIVSLPVGADGFSSGAVDPTLKITWGRDLPAGFGLTGNVNVASITDADERFAQHAASVSLGHAIAGPWSGYLEAYGFNRLAPGGDAAWTFNGGVTLGFGSDMQLDLEAGRGLTADAPDWFIGVGVAVRGPFGRR